MEEFYRIKEDLNKVPTRLELFTYMDNDIYANMKSRAALNILNDYLAFLDKRDELSNEERKLLNTEAHEFIKKIENTKMSQTYKVPLLLAFYNDGNLIMKLSDKDIYENFKEFYNQGSNGTDLLRNETTKGYKDFGEKEFYKIAENPKNAFLNSASEFFYKKDGFYCLSDKLEAYKDNAEFLQHFKDVIEYRKTRFYKERLEKNDEII